MSGPYLRINRLRAGNISKVKDGLALGDDPSLEDRQSTSNHGVSAGFLAIAWGLPETIVSILWNYLAATKLKPLSSLQLPLHSLTSASSGLPRVRIRRLIFRMNISSAPQTPCLLFTLSFATVLNFSLTRIPMKYSEPAVPTYLEKPG